MNKQKIYNQTYYQKNKERLKKVHKKYYQKNKEKRLKYDKQRQKKAKEWFFNYKKTLKCESCPEDRWYCLVFHHKNPEEKKFDISHGFYKYSKEKLLKEINKCRVLCSNCHKALHFNEKQKRDENNVPTFENNNLTNNLKTLTYHLESVKLLTNKMKRILKELEEVK